MTTPLKKCLFHCKEKPSRQRIYGLDFANPIAEF